MKQDKLTEAVVKEAKTTVKQFKLSDGGGLYLLVHSNGSRYWRFDFRFEGKQKSSSLGVWPEVTLAAARNKRDAARRKIKGGVNPIEAKKVKTTPQLEQVQEKEKAEQQQSQTQYHISQEQENKQASQSSGKDIQEAVNLLKSHVYPELGEKSLSEISKQDVTAIFKNIYWYRKEVFQIIWDIYPGYPVVQLGVLFVLILVSMDLLTALATTFSYFTITVCVAIGISVWNDKRDDTA